ncbi:epithelial sodium channel subunit alpha-like [Convolutriloba macropyga]|uniref:epithelial sodium channel subunit alpha-like n=1 Tax=Convolutriloba macropyga TaxID=536237 RepID=UPI003F520F8F
MVKTRKNDARFKLFRLYLQEISMLLEDSTAHGMERIGSGPRKRSIFWIVTFTLSMFMVSSQCWVLICQYLSYGKTVSIALREEKLPEFPYITFCSEFFVPDDVEPHPYYVELTKLARDQITAQEVDVGDSFDNLMPALYEAYTIGNITAERMMEVYYELKEQKYNLTDYSLYPGRYNFSQFREMHEMMSFSGPHKPYSMSRLKPTDYFFDCTFKGEQCNFEDFSVQKSDSYGNCFTFRSPNYRNKLQDPSNSNNALGLKLKVRLPETSNNTRASTRGIRISAHDANQLPSFAEDRGLFTPLGVDAHVRFNQRALERYDNRREHCSNVWPLESPQLIGLAYSDKVCRKLCLEDSLYNHCACALSTLYRNIYPDRDRCMLAENGSHHLCWQQFSAKKVDQKYQQECDRLCHLPCRDVQYILALSSAKYPHENSLIPELLNLMRSSNPIIKNDSHMFLSDLVQLFNMSNYPRCERILMKNPNVSLYTQIMCFVHVNPENWLEELKTDELLYDLIYKIRSMYATIQVTEAENDHEIQTENPEIQLEKLLAEIGGVMGLWVGISVITLMEFVEIIVFSIYFLRSSWRWLSKLPQNMFTPSKSSDNAMTYSTPVKLTTECSEMTTYVNNYINDSLARQNQMPIGVQYTPPNYRAREPTFEIEHQY